MNALHAPSIDWVAVRPELTLVAAAIVVLLVALVRSRTAQVAAAVIALGGLALAAAFTLHDFSHVHLATNAAGNTVGVWSGQLMSDSAANFARLLAMAAGVTCVFLSAWGRKEDGRDGEFHALLLLCVAGMGLFAAAGSLVALFVGLELFSIALYVLCALEAERATALEAGLKYLIIGGVASAVLLYGSALVYGSTGSFDLSVIAAAGHHGLLFDMGAAMILAGLAYKVSAAPLHWWTPDVYDGAPTSITAFMATATKVVGFVALARVCVTMLPLEAHTWQTLLAIIAAFSIVVGNVGALVQQRLKRMLAYSSVAHAGYLAVGLVAWKHVGITALLYALVAYVVMTLGAFAIVQLRERQVGGPVTYTELEGAGWSGGSEYGWLATLPGAAMTICMLSLSGLPPTAGFVGKLSLFSAAVNAGYTWLAVLGVIGSAISLGYYLRVIIVMYVHPAPQRSEAAVSEQRNARGVPVLATAGVVFAVLVMLLGVRPSSTIERASTACTDMLAPVSGPVDAGRRC